MRQVFFVRVFLVQAFFVRVFFVEVFICPGLDVDDRAGENLEFESIGTIHSKGNAGSTGMLPTLAGQITSPERIPPGRRRYLDRHRGGQVAGMHRTTGEDCG